MTSKPPVLFYNIRSPPARAVLMTAKAIGLHLDLRVINVANGDNVTPEYLKMNPQHTIPCLNDNGVIVTDSHAICSYLVGKYAKDDKLYPKDLVKRALVDERLHFDTGVIFTRYITLIYPIYNGVATEFDATSIENIKKFFPTIEAFLEKGNYLCGELSIADFTCFASISAMNQIITFDEEKYPKFIGWIKRMSELPYYDSVNAEGANEIQQVVFQRLKENRNK